MNKKNSSGSGVFLMEMIMVVFFFIICASICILVFVRANHMSRLAKDTNQGVIAAESIAEVWKQEGEDGLRTRMYGISPGGAPEGNKNVKIYWDREWKLSNQPDLAAFEATVSWQEADGLTEAVISLQRIEDNTALFSMNVNRYLKLPQAGGDR